MPRTEWADDQGNIAPITYEAGFVHSMIKYLYEQIDPKLRMPMENVHFPTNANINDYSKIINDVSEGGADIISTSPGWTAMWPLSTRSPSLSAAATSRSG